MKALPHAPDFGTWEGTKLSGQETILTTRLHPIPHPNQHHSTSSWPRIEGRSKGQVARTDPRMSLLHEKPANSGRSHRSHSNTRHRLGSGGLQPACGKPGLRDGKLAPAAIQANLNVRRWRHRRMTHGAWNVAIKPNFRRNNRQGTRLTLWTGHQNTSKGNALQTTTNPFT